MSAAQYQALHTALSEGLATVKTAGQFQSLALADARGLAWAADGSIPMPDHFAAIPSLISRAFEDKQPLLRFFSEKQMRFEHRSDSLAYIKKGLQGVPADAVYLLDVPRGKDGADGTEIVLGWDQSFLVMRNIAIRGENWCLLGITPNANAGRNALAKAASGLASMLTSAAGRPGQDTVGSTAGEAIHARLTAAMESFRATAPDILMAAVTSKDGFVVAELEGGSVDAELVAPLMGHSFLAIQESTEQLCGFTESVMLRMEQGILLTRQLSDDLLFASLLAPTACTGLILSAFENAATSLTAALTALPNVISAPQPQEVPA